VAPPRPQSAAAAADEPRVALWRLAIPVSGVHVRWTAFGRWAVSLLLVVTVLLVTVGISITSFDFEFRGLAALTLEWLDTPTYTTYSIVSLGLAVPSAALDANSFGIRFLQVTFFLFAVAMPFLHLGTLLVLWMCPLTAKAQRGIFIAAEVMNAWSALDVFVIAIIAALLEVRQFAAFMIGNKCDLIDEYLGRLLAAKLDGDSKCFDVVSTLQAGCWILFTACLIYLVVGTLVMRACHTALAQRDKARLGDTSINHDVHAEPKRFRFLWNALHGVLYRRADV